MLEEHNNGVEFDYNLSKMDHAHKEKHNVPRKKPRKRIKLDYWKVSTFVMLALFVASILTNGFHIDDKGLSKDEAAEKTLDFINTNLLQGQAVAELDSIIEEGELYNLKLSLSGQEIDSYITKDGELLFPQAVRMNEFADQVQEENQQQQPVPEVVKSDKPSVELFVMTHCPFGTQAEKGLIPVLELLGDKIDARIRFVHYFMHGEIEETETYRQICIREKEPEKYLAYIRCFLDSDDPRVSGDPEVCMEKAGLSADQINACMDSEAKDYYAEDSELSQGYGVQGSPSLVVNGAMVKSGRSPSAYLNTICTTFNNVPEECGTAELSTQTFSAGFGYSEGEDSAASCG